MYPTLRRHSGYASRPSGSASEGLQVSVVTAPTDAELPVTVDEAKGFCRVDHAADDALFVTLIRAATQAAEGYTRRAIAPQTLRAEWARVGDHVQLPRPPHRAIVKVERITQEGSALLVAGTDYRTRGLAITTIYPNVQYGTAGIAWNGIVECGLRVEYEAGYARTTGAHDEGNPTEASPLPDAIKLAILRMVKHHYEYRADEVVGTVVGRLTSDAKQLLNPFRYYG